MKLERKNYFSLVELMIVVSILALLAAVVAKNVIGQGEAAKLKIAATRIVDVEAAMDFFKIAHSRYPTTEEGIQALVSKPDDPDITGYPERAYLKKTPKDPWGEKFLYLSPGSHGVIDIWSKGPDKNPGTEDDITNWAGKE